MRTAIYPARSAVEHTGPWLLLPLITPQQLHGERTENTRSDFEHSQSCVFDYSESRSGAI